MTSGMLLNAAYIPAEYNKLGQIEVIDKLLTKEQIQGLGNLILSHGHEDELVAIKAHRHFDLALTEAMLEKEDGADGECIVQPVPLDEINGLSKAKPNIIVYNKELDRWFPRSWILQFLHGRMMCSCESTCYLAGHALDDKLMLGAAGRRTTAGTQQLRYLETNWAETRTSEVRLMPAGGKKAPNSTIETTYKFKWEPNGNGGGAMVPAMDCHNMCRPHSEYGHLHETNHRQL